MPLVPDFGIVLGCLAVGMGFRCPGAMPWLAVVGMLFRGSMGWLYTLKMPCLPRYASGTGQSEPGSACSRMPLHGAGADPGAPAATPTLGAPAGSWTRGTASRPSRSALPT